MNKKEAALKLAQQHNLPVDVVTCHQTEKELSFSVGEFSYPFESSGTCSACERVFHVSALRTRDGIEKSSWPIHYYGYFCKSCWSKKILVKNHGS